MSLRLALALALTSSLAAGCHYEDDCVVLQGADEAGLAEPAPSLRNPYTGLCDF